ncbi:MAG: hypothetical protein R2788_23810 [Saprospiraceae bacterium]
MGTWGTAIFSDDLASDIKGAFKGLAQCAKALPSPYPEASLGKAALQYSRSFTSCTLLCLA